MVKGWIRKGRTGTRHMSIPIKADLTLTNYDAKCEAYSGMNCVSGERTIELLWTFGAGTPVMVLQPAVGIFDA